jgi:hypothetical protein
MPLGFQPVGTQREPKTVVPPVMASTATRACEAAALSSHTEPIYVTDSKDTPPLSPELPVDFDKRTCRDAEFFEP